MPPHHESITCSSHCERKTATWVRKTRKPTAVYTGVDASPRGESCLSRALGMTSASGASRRADCCSGSGCARRSHPGTNPACHMKPGNSCPRQHLRQADRAVSQPPLRGACRSVRPGSGAATRSAGCGPETREPESTDVPVPTAPRRPGLRLLRSASTEPSRSTRRALARTGLIGCRGGFSFLRGLQGPSKIGGALPPGIGDSAARERGFD